MRLCDGDVSWLLQEGGHLECGNGGTGVKFYGSRIGYHGNILLRTSGREERRRQKA